MDGGFTFPKRIVLDRSASTAIAKKSLLVHFSLTEASPAMMLKITKNPRKDDNDDDDDDVIIPASSGSSAEAAIGIADDASPRPVVDDDTLQFNLVPANADDIVVGLDISNGPTATRKMFTLSGLTGKGNVSLLLAVVFIY